VSYVTGEFVAHRGLRSHPEANNSFDQCVTPFVQRKDHMKSSHVADRPKLNVLVIGAYGLIGCGVAQRLAGDGHRVTGLGRDVATGKRVLPSLAWRKADLRRLSHEDIWRNLLQDIDVVVNCSGALQDGPDDDLEAVHHHAVSALAKACVSLDVSIIQISATGASLDAATQFLASKARGDAAIQNSGARHCILRPGLVLAPHSYGGTTMLRMLAAVPVVQPLAVPDAKIQTVSLDDVAEVVSAAVVGRIPNGFVADIVEEDMHALRDVVALMRQWLGFGVAKRVVVMPDALTNVTAKIADGLSHLGWRSPLRTTAIKVLDDGVTGQHVDLTEFGLGSIKSLSQTLAAMPARQEDRLFARMALITPIMIATLVVFWFLSGVIGFVRLGEAARVLENVGWPQSLALASVLFWAVVDIGIAVAFAYRPYAKLACWLSIAVSVFYLVASTLFVPQLWLDPLGPLVKIFPGIALALVARIALETR
jgi:uncharacterized protein YbjT (DUF2867 family)